MSLPAYHTVLRRPYPEAGKIGSAFGRGVSRAMQERGQLRAGAMLGRIEDLHTIAQREARSLRQRTLDVPPTRKRQYSEEEMSRSERRRAWQLMRPTMQRLIPEAERRQRIRRHRFEHPPIAT
jgi:hypothetical protein